MTRTLTLKRPDNSKNKKKKKDKEIENPLFFDNSLSDDDLDIINSLTSIKNSNNKDDDYYDINDDEYEDFNNQYRKLRDRYDNEYDELSPKKRKKLEKKMKKLEKKKNKIAKSKMDLSLINIYKEEDETEEEKSKRKNIDDEDFYLERFSVQTALIKGLLQDIENDTIENKKFLKMLQDGNINGTRIKMSPMTITSQMGNINGLYSTKLAAIKHLFDVNKAISEFELKKLNMDEKKNDKKGGNGGGLSMSKIFDQLLADDNYVPEDKDEQKEKESEGKKEKKKDKKKKKKYDSIDDRIKDLEESGEIEFSEYENAFKYEDLDVDIIVERSLSTDEWRFVAIDKDGEEIYDYPVLKKSQIGRMTFSDKDKSKATDSLGAEYYVRYVD